MSKKNLKEMTDAEHLELAVESGYAYKKTNSQWGRDLLANGLITLRGLKYLIRKGFDIEPLFNEDGKDTNRE